MSKYLDYIDVFLFNYIIKLPKNTDIKEYIIKTTLINCWKNLFTKEKNLVSRIDKTSPIIIENGEEKLRLPSLVRYTQKELKDLNINKKPLNSIEN